MVVGSTDGNHHHERKEKKMNYGRYKYYQPNEKDVKDKYGDCTVRALSKALDCTWVEAYKAMTPICLREQVTNIFDVPSKKRADLLSELGFAYTGVSNKRGTKRPTVDSFTKDHTKGTYILNVAHHVVAVVDGKYYDTWDCGHKSVYGYYEKKGEAK